MTRVLTERQKHILHLVLETGEGIGLDGLVRRLEVSRRTIQRDMQAIQAYLDRYRLRLRGDSQRISIEGRRIAIEQMLQETGKLPSGLALTPKDREVHVAMDLLIEHGPMKLGYFGKQLHVTAASLSHNLDDVAVWLRAHGLHLIRRRGYGVEVQGDEEMRREALAELIYNQVALPDLMTIFRLDVGQRANHPLFHWFAKWFGDSRIQVVREVLREELASLDPPLDEAAFYGFMLHVLLTCARIEHGVSLPSAANSTANEDSPDTRICARIIHRLLPNAQTVEGEAAYLAKHLRGAKVFMTDDSRLLPLNLTSMDLAFQMVKQLEKTLGLSFVEDRDLLVGMAQHLEPAIHRMAAGLVIRNPLLNEVRRQYEIFFSAMKSACQQVLQPYGLNVPDEEIGYLTMHLGAAHERRMAQRIWHARIVCPNGISSAQLLASRMRKEFPQIKIVSVESLNSLEDTACELIVSTVFLENRDVPVATVSPFLTKDDVQQIQALLEQLEHSSARAREATAQTFSHFEQQSLSAVNHLGDGVEVHQISVNNARELIEQIADDVVVAGDSDNRDELILAIMQREQIGTIVLPGKRFSVIHARTSALHRCHLAVYRVTPAIGIAGVANKEEPVDTVLVMLAQVDEEPSVIRLLGGLSSALVMDERLVEALRTASIEEVRRRICEAMYQTEE